MTGVTAVVTGARAIQSLSSGPEGMAAGLLHARSIKSEYVLETE